LVLEKYEITSIDQLLMLAEEVRKRREIVMQALVNPDLLRNPLIVGKERIMPDGPEYDQRGGAILVSSPR